MRIVRLFKLFMFFGIISAIAIGMHSINGEVIFVLSGIRIEIPLTFFAVGFTGFSLLLFVLKGLWSFLWKIPEKYHNFLDRKREAKSQNLILDSISALEAKQPKEAAELASIAFHLTPQNPVALYLVSKGNILVGDFEKAVNYFDKMLKEPRLKFLGLCGLIMLAKKEKDLQKVFKLLEQAIKLRHDSPWLIETFKENNIRLIASNHFPKDYKDNLYKFMNNDEWESYAGLQNYVKALKVQETLDSSGVIELFKKSLYLRPDFLPSAIALSEVCLQKGCDSKMFKLLLKTAILKPHPLLLNNLLMLGRYETPAIAYQFFSQTLSMEKYENLLFLANLASKAALLDAAKDFVEKAMDVYPTWRAYKCLQAVFAAKQQLHNVQYGHVKEDYSWQCKKCSTIHSAYHVFCESCGEMDAINYDQPLLYKANNLGEGLDHAMLMVG